MQLKLLQQLPRASGRRSCRIATQAHYFHCRRCDIFRRSPSAAYIPTTAVFHHDAGDCFSVAFIMYTAKARVFSTYVPYIADAYDDAIPMLPAKVFHH